ncbi:MAG: hypothetical protein ACK6BC_06290, partial [Cyanobacteriota bacterium]
EQVDRVEGREIDVKPSAYAKQGLQSLMVHRPSAVSFLLKATLSPLTPGERVNIMDRLKAEGLQRRLELLRREGLLK